MQAGGTAEPDRNVITLQYLFMKQNILEVFFCVCVFDNGARWKIKGSAIHPKGNISIQNFMKVLVKTFDSKKKDET